ncbi:MAG TPA: 2-phospho-L-lactate transferase CofD family protein, partial [bacterium]|nr:2-phospho-L-lactate transferase CofD family protein [bacterium]
GKVLPATLENVDLKIFYEDGTSMVGEYHLDEELKQPKKISFNKNDVSAYPKATEALVDADLIVIGPGSLFGSVLPNLLIPEIKGALISNKWAMKVYVANCSTERTQTAHFSVEDHIRVIFEHTKEKVFDYCLVNKKIIRQSKRRKELGEINNITTDKKVIDGVEVVLDDVISEENPLFHDSAKLAKALLDLYNRVGRS